MATNVYTSNKPLVNSAISGFLYFLLCWSASFTDLTFGMFYIVMLIVPGFTFPILTCYLHTSDHLSGSPRAAIHLVLSMVIYHGCVWLFSGVDHYSFLPGLAGFSGSFFFLITTKFILKVNLKFIHIVLVAIISGLCFLPLPFMEGGLYMGAAVFLWTVANGFLLNREYRMTLSKSSF